MTPEEATNGTAAEAPDPIDVFAEAMLDLDSAHYISSYVVARVDRSPGRMTAKERDDLAYPLYLTTPEVLKEKYVVTCFVGRAAVKKIDALCDMHEYTKYTAIAQVYHVPYGLVQEVGDGVVGLPFRTAKATVRRIIKEWKAQRAAKGIRDGTN